MERTKEQNRFCVDCKYIKTYEGNVFGCINPEVLKDNNANGKCAFLFYSVTGEEYEQSDINIIPCMLERSKGMGCSPCNRLGMLWEEKV